MTTTTAPARKVFRVLGTTDEVTECEHCGRVDLKGTIRLGALDADGNVEDVTYFGAVCGARAVGWTTKDIRKQAIVADRDRIEAERLAAADAAYAATALLYGTADCPSGPTMCRKDRPFCLAHS